MKALGVFGALCLTVVTARLALAQAVPAGIPSSSATASTAFATLPPAAPPPAVAPSNTLPDVTDQAADGEYDPNMYADSVDTDVTYDDQVAQSYDDGYDPQAYTQFADALSPYGTWIDDSAYGRVWMPSSSIVGADFSPYGTNGHWAMTEYGWTWVSAWDWGWAPFHYGRWAMLGGRGWGWIPGTLWGPAWVSWRAGGGYVGWAPLPPRGMGLGRPIGMRSPWRFTAASRLSAMQPAYLSSRAVPAIFSRTFVISNRRTLSMNGAAVRVNAGPPSRLADERGAPVAPARFAAVAPRGIPPVAIQPHAGVAIAGRPWTQAGIKQQAPVYRWPASSPVAQARGPVRSGAPRSAGLAPGFAPTSGFVASAGRPSASWAGAPRVSARTFVRPYAAPYSPPRNQYQGPIYRPAAAAAPQNRWYAPPTAMGRPFVPAPAYRAQPMYHPAPYSFGGGSRSPGFSGGGGHFGAGGGGSHFGGGGGHFGGGGHVGGGGRR